MPERLKKHVNRRINPSYFTDYDKTYLSNFTFLVYYEYNAALELDFFIENNFTNVIRKQQKRSKMSTKPTNIFERFKIRRQEDLNLRPLA